MSYWFSPQSGIARLHAAVEAHRQVTQVTTSFQIQTELLKKKLEKVPDVNEAMRLLSIHPDSGIPRTKDVKLLRNGLTRMLATYTTTYMDMAEIFDRYEWLTANI